MAKACEVCCSPCSKYKCPTCYINYCSVACCKKHQFAKCSLKQKTIINTIDKKEVQLFTTFDTVPPENLEHLSHNNNIKEILLNPHLCNLLKEINEASDAAVAIRKAMQIPIFMEFANGCLHIVENNNNHH